MCIIYIHIYLAFLDEIIGWFWVPSPSISIRKAEAFQPMALLSKNTS